MLHRGPQDRIDAIVLECAAQHDVHPRDMRGGWRVPKAIAARRAAIGRLRTELLLGKPAIARAVGLGTSQVAYWLTTEDRRAAKRARSLERGNRLNAEARECRAAL